MVDVKNFFGENLDITKVKISKTSANVFKCCTTNEPIFQNLPKRFKNQTTADSLDNPWIAGYTSIIDYHSMECFK